MCATGGGDCFFLRNNGDADALDDDDLFMKRGTTLEIMCVDTGAMDLPGVTFLHKISSLDGGSSDNQYSSDEDSC